jgi:hypothetical protein
LADLASAFELNSKSILISQDRGGLQAWAFALDGDGSEAPVVPLADRFKDW